MMAVQSANGESNHEGKSNKPFVPGVIIDEPVVEYTPRDGDQRRFVPPIPVTLYETEPMYHQGKIITVNKLYMVYSIRSGYLRVINKFSAKRGLLKGHTSQLMDAAFRSNDSDVLASVNKDGSIIVWELSERDSGIECRKLLHLVAQVEETGYFKRVKWNPKDRHILFTLSDKSQIDVWRIDQFEILSSVTIDENLPKKAYQCIQSASNVEIHDIGVSFDGRFLASGGEEVNKLALWEIPEGGIGDYELILEWQPHGNDVMQSLHFLGSSKHPQLANFLITGGPFNREFKLWSLQDIRQGSLRLLQTLSFVPNPSSKPSHWDDQPFLNVALVDPKSQFLVVCNQKDPVAWLIHIKPPLANSDGDWETRMDYITEHDVQQNVISFGLSNRLRAAGDGKETEAPQSHGIGLICIQTKSIQLWQFDHIMPPEREPPPLAAPKEAEEPPAVSLISPSQVGASEARPDKVDLNADAAALKEKRRQELMKYLSDADEKPTASESPQAPQADTTGSELQSKPLEPAGLDSTVSTGTPTSVSMELAYKSAPAPPSTPASYATVEAPGHPSVFVDPPPLAAALAVAPAVPPAPEFQLPPGLAGNSAALAEHALRQLHEMQHAQAFQWAQMQAALAAQQAEFQRRLDELRTTLVSHSQRHDEAAANALKDQRQTIMQFHAQLSTTTVKQFQDMQRTLADRTKESIDQLRPLLTTNHVQSETRQKQFCEDLLRDVRKEMAQFKETIQTVVRSKEISDMAKQRLKEAVDAEQQRMQKLLETVSTTILNNIPDQLEQKFEAKLDATIQKKLLPSLGSSVDAKLERCVKDGLRQQLQGVLPQLEAAVQRSVEQARTSLQTDEVNRSLRPDVLGPNISRALADQEQVIVQTVTDPLCRVLPKAVERAVEAQLSQALPKMLQQLMTEVLTKMANKGGAREGDGPAPPPAAPRVTKEDILVLLKAKDYEKAFNTVLGLSSIDMVEWLCGQLSVRDVFEGEECLSNPVILSLIHQLAWALNNETQMKLYWLQEALVALNPQDSIIKHHVPEVLGQVTLLLEKFFDASSEAGQRKSARALMMMVKSVVQDI